MNPVPAIRIQNQNSRPINPDGEFILYWMTAYRRLTSNFSLDRAIEWSLQLNRPLIILEALRCDYQWASRRLHTFAIQGMKDNQKTATTLGHCYVPYVEPASGCGSGLLTTLATKACVVVTDDFPCFFLPKMIRSVGRRIPVLMEVVDSNGLLPMRAATSVFPTAYAFRRFLQKTLPPHLDAMPSRNPLAAPEIARLTNPPGLFTGNWQPAGAELLNCEESAISALPIDHSVSEAAMHGGCQAANKCLSEFLKHRLARYAQERSEPDEDVASGISPYLHFGHISAHQVFQQLTHNEHWSPDQLGDPKVTQGSRGGWWGTSEAAESFLDELVTWRELGFNMCWQQPNFDRYESLPEWARQSLAKHAGDPRPVVYSLDQLQNATTDDALWNAAQNQLVTEGRMHNYLRMLWGKKILQWSPTAEDALAVMIELNNRFAVDGRNPNSYSGIFWVLGRYDRAWGPERPIFGKIRYMTSENTAKKLNVTKYLRKYGADKQGKLF